MQLNATEFHSQVVEEFDNKYLYAPDFIERKKVWGALLERHINSDSKVLDAGSGSGIFSFMLAEKGCSVSAFDGSEKMIEFCQKAKAQQNLNNLSFQHLYLPLTDEVINEKFDAIISSSVLEYVDQMEESITSLNKRLKNNGLMILSFPNGQSLYRILEKIVFKLTGKPKYYGHIKNTPSTTEVNLLLKKEGFEVLDIQFYGGNSLPLRFLRYLLPNHFSCNLFVGVYKKIQK